ncbi:hypothetical protein SDC9_200708 [bioreactor metagenome]|uniref:Uncharacterized protein n=1 Tax=bioreactor metagenome TaxID=1076179 RepID=A0A645INX5_9ZZZZ
MVDQEMLQAMRSIMQEELKPVNERLDRIESDVHTLKTDMQAIKEDISELQEYAEETHSATNYVAEWVENMAEAVPKLKIVQPK